jgi:hypothetical protein
MDNSTIPTTAAISRCTGDTPAKIAEALHVLHDLKRSHVCPELFHRRLGLSLPQAKALVDQLIQVGVLDQRGAVGLSNQTHRALEGDVWPMRFGRAVKFIRRSAD